MKVHVICHGLFGVVIPDHQNYVEPIFLDAAGWNDPAVPIPPHELFVHYSAASGEVIAQKLPRGEIVIEGMPAGAPTIHSQPVSLSEVIGATATLRPQCDGSQPAASCQLNQKPLIHAKLRLQGGELFNCEFDMMNGVDLTSRNNGWGHQHLDYEWDSKTHGSHVKSTTFNAVCFTFESEGEVALRFGGRRVAIGRMARVDPRLDQLGDDFALIVLNNTVPKSGLGGHFHVEPSRDLHSLLFHDLLADPLPVAERPVPTLTRFAPQLPEAPPLNRCIPYSA